MRSFKNILALYSSDASVLKRMIEFAQSNEARLTLIDVTRKMDNLNALAKPGGPSIDLQELVTEKLNEQLKQAVASVTHDKPRVKTKVLVGSPAFEIIREVIRNKHDLVMLGAEGKGGVRERLFGSTSLHLMRACPCPVLVVNPAHPSRFTKVLAAVDIDPSDATKSALNGSIVEFARSISDMEQAELHLVHAWTLYGEGLLEGLAGLDAADVERMVGEEGDQRRKLVEALANELKATSAQLHVVKGDASDVIPSVVKSQAIELLVIGTVCRTGVAGFFIGNTAETVLDRVNCSVLAIKPEGYASPIKVEG